MILTLFVRKVGQVVMLRLQTVLYKMEATNARNRPKYKAYVQGNLKAYQPMHTSSSTVIALLLISGILLAAGFNIMRNSSGNL